MAIMPVATSYAKQSALASMAARLADTSTLLN